MKLSNNTVATVFIFILVVCDAFHTSNRGIGRGLNRIYTPIYLSPLTSVHINAPTRVDSNNRQIILSRFNNAQLSKVSVYWYTIHL